MNQVSDDVEGTPRRAAFVRRDPAVRQSAQQRVECRRCSRQDCHRFLNHERAPRALGLCSHVDFVHMLRLQAIEKPERIGFRFATLYRNCWMGSFGRRPAGVGDERHLHVSVTLCGS